MDACSKSIKVVPDRLPLFREWSLRYHPLPTGLYSFSEWVSTSVCWVHYESVQHWEGAGPLGQWADTRPLDIAFPGGPVRSNLAILPTNAHCYYHYLRPAYIRQFLMRTASFLAVDRRRDDPRVIKIFVLPVTLIRSPGQRQRHGPGPGHRRNSSTYISFLLSVSVLPSPCRNNLPGMEGACPRPSLGKLGFHLPSVASKLLGEFLPLKLPEILKMSLQGISNESSNAIISFAGTNFQRFKVTSNLFWRFGCA